MKVSIFGASGATGLLLTGRCLAAGHEVTALLRKPAEFKFHDRVRVAEGNAFDAAAVRQTVEGADIVLSALGARSLKKEDVLERAVPLIVAAMSETGVRLLSLFGPTDPRVWSPVGKQVRVIWARDYGGPEMNRIPLADVKAGVAALMS